MENASTGNRYLIYKLLGRRVKCDPVGFGKKVKAFHGVVEKVTRDIFDNSVVVTVGGQHHAFQEPAAIFEDEDNLVFIYGELEKFDESDDALFRDVRASAYGDTVLDILRRVKPTGTKTMSFEIGPKAQVQERRAWNRRESVSI